MQIKKLKNICDACIEFSQKIWTDFRVDDQADQCKNFKIMIRVSRQTLILSKDTDNLMYPHEK